jgi:cell wall-associated NlpC family hydrolase
LADKKPSIGTFKLFFGGAGSEGVSTPSVSAKPANAATQDLSGAGEAQGGDPLSDEGKIKDAPMSMQLKTPSAEPGTVKGLDAMLDFAKEFKGTPYLSPSLVMKYGVQGAQQLVASKTGSMMQAMDCSTFARTILQSGGVLPKGWFNAEKLFEYYKGNGTVLTEPKRGALVFYEPFNKQTEPGKWDSGKKITHVAIATSPNTIIDSSSSQGGVTERALKPSTKYKYHYIMPRYPAGV